MLGKLISKKSKSDTCSPTSTPAILHLLRAVACFVILMNKKNNLKQCKCQQKCKLSHKSVETKKIGDNNEKCGLNS